MHESLLHSVFSRADRAAIRPIRLAAAGLSQQSGIKKPLAKGVFKLGCTAASRCRQHILLQLLPPSLRFAALHPRSAPFYP